MGEHLFFAWIMNQIHAWIPISPTPKILLGGGGGELVPSFLACAPEILQVTPVERFWQAPPPKKKISVYSFPEFSQMSHKILPELDLYIGKILRGTVPPCLIHLWPW